MLLKNILTVTCVYCGETYDINELTLDHVHPRHKGGEDISSNVMLLLRCNQEKGTVHYSECETPHGTNIREQYIHGVH